MRLDGCAVLIRQFLGSFIAVSLSKHLIYVSSLY